MKKNLILLSVLIFMVLMTVTNIVTAQDANKAMQYFNSEQYEQAVLEFEGAMPAIEKEYGKKDTSYYSKLLLYKALSFECYNNYKKAEQYIIWLVIQFIKV